MTRTAAAVLKPVSHDERPDIGLDDAYLATMSEKLSEILAATYRLTVKSHIYHWNVVGPLFKPLHELTEEHYNALFAATDVIAERIRALGHLAPATLADAKNFAPRGGDVSELNASDMVADLIHDHSEAVKTMRAAATIAGDAGDVVTEDMLTAHLTFHEKALWMLRAIAAT
ncbi:MAG: DNA starvation/stationary phase protection protein [Stappia sp.]|uniref:Dps family protein n=1 Tax=Stappia sp. TaxID=1870903 RepID=UPI000C686A29|nr:DNA starvation/stationary phase protection protein [Stappia sp.]MAB00162.1 DNA starvation/stationary phase protection protein [Stappia sp.]MBM20801.1 DNA starvation/stationary phase protection protein [Stappia sp.]|tara:strand:- start:1831 stop:2346 length:516 start_codon:yes stop_codon:yes gene_type:complete